MDSAVAMRLAVSSFVAACALLSAGRAVAAAPCTIGIADVRAVPPSHEYAVTLASRGERRANLRITLYAAGAAYVANLPDVSFDREDAGNATSPGSRLAAPTFVRVPPDALPSVDALVEEVDGATGAPTGCDDYVALDPTTGSARMRRGSPRRADPTDRETVDALAATTNATVVNAVAAPPDVAVCAQPFATARVERIAQAAYPLSARANRETGNVDVRVDLSDAGAVLASAIFRSSGYDDLDAAARAAAVATTYRPAIVRCLAVVGSYVFRVDFTATNR